MSDLSQYPSALRKVKLMKGQGNEAFHPALAERDPLPAICEGRASEGLAAEE